MGYDAVVDSAKLNGALTATAEAIRSKTDSTEPIPFDMDEGFKSAVESIETGGGDTEAAYNEGVEAGKKAEYDAFWDEYQEKGDRSYYANAFANVRWNDITYKPKYHIRPLASFDTLFQESRITDTKVDIDFSRITSPKQVNRTFAYNTALVTIRKVIVNENIIFSSWFSSCNRLESVTFEGVIGQNGLNFQWSTKLSKASITSVVNCLSTATSGLTVTFSKTAKETAFTDDEWTALANTRPNWTITLV